MKIKFCESYQILRLLSLKAELAELPNVRVGTLRGRTVVRRYYKNSKGNVVFKSSFADTPAGQKICQTAVRREEIETEIKNIENQLGKHIADMLERCKFKLCKSILNESLWNSLGNDENPQPKTSDYHHNGIQMRSRTEVLVAEILDELGLEYKYEPKIQFGNEVFHPDFLVYIRSLKRCLIIEFFGMSEDESYLYKNVHKVSVYANCGLIMNRDVIGLFGSKDSLVSNEFIYNCVVMTINLLASEVVQLK